MCCADFIAKYVLFILNLVFSLLGLAVAGLGIAGLVTLQDLQEILPVNFIAISLIILGFVAFIICFLACCGAIRENRCMLIFYAIIVGILTIGFIYLTIVIFNNLADIEETVYRWISNAFGNEDLKPAFNVMEAVFRCCGTAGAGSYIAAGLMLPPSCCPEPSAESTCLVTDAFSGCGDMVGEWFRTFSGAIGIVMLVVIIVQVTSVFFALFLTYSISDKRKRTV